MSVSANEFDGPWFWRQIHGNAKRFGAGLLERALLAYFVARDPKTPAWAQSVLLGALVYLGMPQDLVPDYIPVVGFSDDLATLVAALTAVAANVRPRHYRRAARLLHKWHLA
ncbi:DUF1232 domain-containing protein [Cellulomonas sp.]|uniref:YkvA family protein n=1 Tax=Cellulomonas sp. TaxID=40001 RepID=UPI00258D9FB8|nr:DUF1232 domain-containing protein [Cellulomonas sp.]MCR6689566.1 DUF1232 domain-containing protein [Cellulomonas sp.]